MKNMKQVVWLTALMVLVTGFAACATKPPSGEQGSETSGSIDTVETQGNENTGSEAIPRRITMWPSLNYRRGLSTGRPA